MGLRKKSVSILLLEAYFVVKLDVHKVSIGMIRMLPWMTSCENNHDKKLIHLFEKV